MFADHEIGRRAVPDRALLADVVRFKKVFYRAGYASYDACTSGGHRLVPARPMLASVREDFAQMVASGMFEGEPPVFGEIIERLGRLEQEINGTAGVGPSSRLPPPEET
jgi:hypothetical protein